MVCWVVEVERELVVPGVVRPEADNDDPDTLMATDRRLEDLMEGSFDRFDWLEPIGVNDNDESRKEKERKENKKMIPSILIFRSGV